MIAPQYDYAHSLNAQQPPMLDTALELPNSSARSVTFPHYSPPPRNQLGLDFPASSRYPSPEFRYGPSTERRLPGGPYIRPTGNSSSMTVESDHKSPIVPSSARSDTSPSADASTSVRDSRKETPAVVIACRQWYVHPINILPLSDSRPLVEAVKFDAIRQGPFATTVCVDQMSASMTWYQSGEVLISVLVRANDPVKRGQQMAPLLHPPNENELHLSERRSNESFFHRE
jgi:hypothetical protein